MNRNYERTLLAFVILCAIITGIARLVKGPTITILPDEFVPAERFNLDEK